MLDGLWHITPLSEVTQTALGVSGADLSCNCLLVDRKAWREAAVKSAPEEVHPKCHDKTTFSKDAEHNSVGNNCTTLWITVRDKVT